MTSSPARRVRTACAAALTVAVLVSGCTGGTGASQDAAAQDSGPLLLQPGRPGEAAREVKDVGEITVDDSWNHADVAFMQMMIPHHGQALDMARLAQRHASHPQVRTLAERIRAAQGPEITVMAGWLEERKMEVPRATDEPESFDHSQHGHSAMAGMMTAARMEELAHSRGARFDRLFLNGMIAHHRGALGMADDVAVGGVDRRVSEISTDVAATQAAEIARMQDLLRSI